MLEEILEGLSDLFFPLENDITNLCHSTIEDYEAKISGKREYTGAS